jgi:hypothetical protein
MNHTEPKMKNRSNTNPVKPSTTKIIQFPLRATTQIQANRITAQLATVMSARLHAREVGQAMNVDAGPSAIGFACMIPVTVSSRMKDWEATLLRVDHTAAEIQLNVPVSRGSAVTLQLPGGLEVLSIVRAVSAGRATLTLLDPALTDEDLVSLLMVDLQSELPLAA